VIATILGVRARSFPARTRGARQLRARTKDFALYLMFELHQIEELYAESLYGSHGPTDKVKHFVRYNANKALMNLGYEALFPDPVCQVSPAIMAALSSGPDGKS